MTAPRHALRLVFAASCFCCCVILVLFIRGRAPATATFWVQTLLMALGLGVAACLFVFRKGRLLLAAVPISQLLAKFGLHLFVAYLVCAALITAVGLAGPLTLTGSAASSLALAGLAGLWLSLWLAPGIAAISTSRALARRQTAA